MSQTEHTFIAIFLLYLTCFFILKTILIDQEEIDWCEKFMRVKL